MLTRIRLAMMHSHQYGGGGMRNLPILCWDTLNTGNPGSVIAPQYGSSKITVFEYGVKVRSYNLLEILNKGQWNLLCS